MLYPDCCGIWASLKTPAGCCEIMKRYVVALDEGTTGARTVIFDRNGAAVSSAQHELRQIYPKPGYVEQDANEIYACQYSTLTEAVFKSGIDPAQIAAIGITNQRETTIVWERATGKPIYNAIVWQCRRTADMCRKLVSEGWSDYIKKTTGLIPDAYFSATKLKWILDNVDGARERAKRGELLFGTVDTWLLWKLTGGRVHATDYSNASRTMLYNINRLCWDKKLLELFDIPECILPDVRSSGEVYDEIDLLGNSVPICGMAGDQQAALFGQCCFDAGDAKSTYGTGCFLLANTGSERIESKNELLTTLGATVRGRPVNYVLEGSVFVGGAVVQWLRDEMKLIHDVADSEYFAKKVPDSGGVYVVPAFAGLGAPYWDMYARGTIVGLTRGSGKNHIIRAALESIAYQTNDVIHAMIEDTGADIKVLRADGGASGNGFLMQFQADISDVTVRRALSTEATARGAAYLAGLACGFYRDCDELKEFESECVEFVPQMEQSRRRDLLHGWYKAIGRSRNWEES